MSYVGALAICLLLVCFVGAAGCHCFDLYELDGFLCMVDHWYPRYPEIFQFFSLASLHSTEYSRAFSVEIMAILIQAAELVWRVKTREKENSYRRYCKRKCTVHHRSLKMHKILFFGMILNIVNALVLVKTTQIKCYLIGSLQRLGLPGINIWL